MASSASAYPWLWTIEALANLKEVDLTLLTDLVKGAPEISDGLGKCTREIVSLRILEGFVAKRRASRKDDGAYLSEPCADVVRRIMNKASSSDSRKLEREALKWDLQTFVAHKRSCLPASTLVKLKHAIVGGNHSIVPSLKKMSGLSVSRLPECRTADGDGDLDAFEERLDGSCSDDQILVAQKDMVYPDPKKAHGSLQEESPIGTSDTLRDGSDFCHENQPVKSHGDAENQPVMYHGDNIGMDTGCDPSVHKAKKIKNDASSSSQAINQTSVTKTGNEVSEGFFSGNGQQSQSTVKIVSDQAEMSQMEVLEKIRVSDGGHDQQIAKRTLGQLNEADVTGLEHNCPQSFHNNEVARGIHNDGPRSDLHDNETEDDGENYAEKGISTAAHPDRYHQIIWDDEDRNDCEKTQLKTSNVSPLDGSRQNCCPDEARYSMEHNDGQEISSDPNAYQDEEIDVARKKHSFLSSQCAYGSEFKLCMKCNTSGQLLVCSVSACPLVVHQTCLGSEPCFDDNRNFYCPFCAYSRAISEYREVKKKINSARTGVTAFMGLENGDCTNNPSKRSENNQVKEHDNMHIETQVHKNKDNYETNGPPCKEDVQNKQHVEPSKSCVKDDLPSRDEDETVDDETCCGLVKDTGEGEKNGLEFQSMSVSDGQGIEAQAGLMLGDKNLSSTNAEILHATNGQAVVRIQQQDVQQPIKEPAENIDFEEISKEEHDKATPNYSKRLRKQETLYTSPKLPLLVRRKKLPWTAEEVEKLKDGVSRFSNVNDRSFPWTKILIFGSDVFQKGRTAVDLKDKWRNICKGGSKLK